MKSRILIIIEEFIIFFAIYDGLGITEKNNIQYIYMWVLGESYCLDNSEIKELSGYSMFYKLTFENNKCGHSRRLK